MLEGSDNGMVELLLLKVNLFTFECVHYLEQICPVFYIAGCDQNLPRLHVNEGADVKIQFGTVDVPGETVSLKAYNVNLRDITMLIVRYISGSPVVDDGLDDVTFTGVAETGNIELTIRNISTSRAGKYRLFVPDSDEDTDVCRTVYVLGMIVFKF